MVLSSPCPPTMREKETKIKLASVVYNEIVVD